MAHAWEGRAVALQLHCHRSALKAIAGIPPLRRRRVGNAPHAISFLQELCSLYNLWSWKEVCKNSLKRNRDGADFVDVNTILS